MNSEDLDRIIDRALSEYTEVAPLDGIEARVTMCVRSAVRKRRGMILTAVALVAAATLAAVFALTPQRSPSPPSQIVQRPPAMQIENKPVLRETRRGVLRPRKPKRMFAEFVPLTGEERALLALAARDPEAARAALAEPERSEVSPIVIPKLEIEPLQQDGGE